MSVRSFSAFRRQSESYEHKEEKKEIFSNGMPDIRGVCALSRKARNNLTAWRKKGAAAAFFSGVFDFFFRFIYFFKALTLTFVMTINILQGPTILGKH